MGRARAVSKGLQSVVIDYDALGRPTKEAGVHGKDISYSYDDALGKQTVFYHDGAADNYSVTYEADALGRMKRVEESRNAALKELANYQYNILGQMTKITYGNGQSIDYSFEPDNDLDKIINTMSGQTVTYDYGHDTTGLTTSKVTTPASYDWTPIYQETQTTTVNSLNQAISINTATISYDNRGNLTGDGVYALTWSKENLLLNVTKQGVEVGRYTYGPLGRRTEKTNQYGTTKYILAGQNVMSELNGSGALLRRYVYGPGTDQPIAMIKANGSREYYHYDGQGSVIATSGDNGVVVASYVYDSYGRSSDLTGNPYRYAGRRVDIETGFYYNRARYYSPQLGRFLSADPIGYGDGLNMYAYAGNNPMNFRDPSGLSEDYIIEDVVSIGSDLSRDTANATANEVANETQKDAINDSVQDAIYSFESQSPLAASLTGYKNIGVKGNRSANFNGSTIRGLTTSEELIWNFGLIDISNCLHGYCPPSARQELFFDLVSFALPIGKAKSVGNLFKGAFAKAGVFLGPKGPVFGQSMLGAPKAGFFNKGRVRFGWTHFGNKAVFRIGIGQAHIIIPFLSITRVH